MIRNYLLTTGDTVRSNNLLVHPNGKLYGERSRIGCYTWSPLADRIILFDTFGSVRFIFHRKGEHWEYRGLPEVNPSGGLSRHGVLQVAGRGPVKMRTPKADYLLSPQHLPGGKRQFEIVIAKYKEDISWSDCYLANATIYSKDPRDASRFRVLPNLGREGGTYLLHIAENYDRLADWTLFLQGDPFPHPLLPFQQYASTDLPFVAAHRIRQSMDWTVPWSAPAQRIDRAVMMDFLRLLESDPAITEFTWTQGAQFAVAREQIRKRPLSYYQRLFEITPAAHHPSCRPILR